MVEPIRKTGSLKKKRIRKKMSRLGRSHMLVKERCQARLERSGWQPYHLSPLEKVSKRLQSHRAYKRWWREMVAPYVRNMRDKWDAGN